jgi:CheY-like chemotaxis protein/HPt (histidine-containing phosphotransfer) domain-containing protein
MQSSAAEQVVRNYCERFPAQLLALSQLLESQNSGMPIKSKLHRVLEESHRMAGAANCMGFNFIGAELMQIEQEAARVLASNEPPEDGLRHICEKLVHLVGFRRHVRTENSRLLRRGSDHEIEINEDVQAKSQTQLFAAQRVLFADDDGAVRALMRALLVDLGIGKVQIAQSGREALEMARNFDPTILISDWRMQPMDGLELLTKIRSGGTHLSSNTRIIFLTSQTGANEVRQVIRRGVDHFLIKPFTREVIARAITKVAGRE